MIVSSKQPRPPMQKFDLRGLPDGEWTGQKRRSMFRPRRVDHLVDLALEQAEADRLRVLPEVIALKP